jgi:uncharacterized repeat protein (TIGR01451 family)
MRTERTWNMTGGHLMRRRFGLALAALALPLGTGLGVVEAVAQVITDDVGVTKTVDVATPLEGATVTYTVTATNNGSNTATSVSVADTLPAGVTYTSDDGAGAFAAGIWTVPDLPAGMSAVLHLSATVDAGTIGSTIVNQATISATADTVSTNNVASASIAPRALSADVSVSKSVDQPFATDGANVVFTIVVANAGPDAAAGVTVTDLLPAALAYVSDDGAGAYNAPTWTVGALASGTTRTLHVTATVPSGSDGQTFANTATVAAATADPNATNNTATATVAARVNDLCAKAGSTTLPGGVVAPIWGYVIGDCTSAATPTTPGGPTIVANQGDMVSITLHTHCRRHRRCSSRARPFSPTASVRRRPGSRPTPSPRRHRARTCTKRVSCRTRSTRFPSVCTAPWWSARRRPARPTEPVPRPTTTRPCWC